MNVEELKEGAEHAHNKGEKRIGLTMAIVAVLLAIATMLGHRAHTEEVKLQTKVNDGWGFYQAKHDRAHQYGRAAEDELASNHRDLAASHLKISIDEECGIPAEHGCTSPVVKNSPVLPQFVKELGAAAAGGSGTGHDNAPETKAQKAESSGNEKSSAKTHKDGAVDILEHTREMENETSRVTVQANYYDLAELFLEMSIVLCSIALLAEMRLFWQLSFVTTIIGVVVMFWGMLGVH
jgi:hypothetical protein